MRAAVLALQEYPVVNSVIDGNEIVRRNFVDISLAVATPTGLMVPVLRDCQNKKFHELELVSISINRRAWVNSLKRANREKLQLKTCKEELSQFLMVEHLDP